MPRPKPTEPLKPRAVRLTERQWGVFTSVGGVEWLRYQLDRHRGPTYLTKEKIRRNQRIRIDRAAGMLIKDIMIRHQVSRSTVHNVLR